MMWAAGVVKFLLTPFGRWVGIALLAVAFVGWLRWDAVMDDRKETEADQNKAIIEHLGTSEQEKIDVENMDVDDLKRELLKRLSGGNDND